MRTPARTTTTTPSEVPRLTSTPSPAVAPTDTCTPTATHTLTPAPTPFMRVITYVVEAGDTLGLLAKEFDTTVADIACVCAIANVNLIEVDQVLTLPHKSGIALAPPRIPAQVPRVIDGDTIEVAINGQSHRVRYIGIDCPETVHPDRGIEWMGPEAVQANKGLVQGSVVCLEKDISGSDKYGRLLRYVWVGDLLVNAELVRLGCCLPSTYQPDVKHQDDLLKAQKEAREAGRGLWGPAPTATMAAPTLAPTPSSPPPTASLTAASAKPTSTRTPTKRPLLPTPMPTRMPSPTRSFVPSDRARDFVGQVVTVRIRRAYCSYRPDVNGGPTFCNDAPYPAHSFTLLVWGQDWSDYNGHCLLVYGRVTTYEGKPEIQLEDRGDVSLCD